jgi:hypothetical protein
MRLAPDQVATMVAMQERQYSGFAAHFARLLADGDAKIVQGLYPDTGADDDVMDLLGDDAWLSPGTYDYDDVDLVSL